MEHHLWRIITNNEHYRVFNENYRILTWLGDVKTSYFYAWIFVLENNSKVKIF